MEHIFHNGFIIIDFHTLKSTRELVKGCIQSDTNGQLKPPVDLDLGYFSILPLQLVAMCTVAAHQLPELTNSTGAGGLN